MHSLTILSQMARASESNYGVLDAMGPPFYEGLYTMLGK